jgi:cell division protein FtsZ
VRPTVRATEPASRPMGARPAVATAADNRAPNLFQRITGAFATPKGLTPVVAGPMAAAPQPVAAEPAPAPRMAAPAENLVAVAPAPAKAPAPRPAPVQTSISLDVNERTKPARDDDDLQIPAFLRRQAN